jgi:hypothetical protein
MSPLAASTFRLDRSYAAEVPFEDPDHPILRTAPWELTKSRKKVVKQRREYLTPLPRLAQEIIKRLAKHNQLMTERSVLCLKSALGLERCDQKP